MNKKRLLVFNSGSGSGFQELVENSKTGVLDGHIVGLITNNKDYKCIERAKKLGIQYTIMTSFDAEDYQSMVGAYQADFVLLSGWLKLVKGLNPKTTINIHPGPLPKFGGKGMWGHHVHEAVMKAFKAGEITETAVTMHFVNEKFDDGPICFEYPILIRDDDTSEILAARVNKIEHGWQSFITNLIIKGILKPGDKFQFQQ
ncbi:MAG TPA: formyltransferase family protein [Candidatus Absconditabacterales bacterium]|nr:formyltransferase family protein [Candidatus Absconditabacterales bacterium]